MGQKILEAIITGTFAAATWAGLSWLETWRRDYFLELRIRRSFARVGAGHGGAGMLVQLFNRTEQEVRVREVRLFTNAGPDLILSPTGVLTYADKAEPVHGHGAIMFGDNPAAAAIRGTTSPPTWPTVLEVESNASWLLPNNTCRDETLRPDGGCCVVDFQTVFGPRRGLRIVFDAATSKTLAKGFDGQRAFMKMPATVRTRTVK